MVIREGDNGGHRGSTNGLETDEHTGDSKTAKLAKVLTKPLRLEEDQSGTLKGHDPKKDRNN